MPERTPEVQKALECVTRALRCVISAREELTEAERELDAQLYGHGEKRTQHPYGRRATDRNVV